MAVHLDARHHPPQPSRMPRPRGRHFEHHQIVAQDFSLRAAEEFFHHAKLVMWQNIEAAFNQKFNENELKPLGKVQNLISPKNLIGDKKSTYYCLTWSISDTDTKDSFGFNVIIYGTNIYMGICLLENDKMIANKDGIMEKYRELLSQKNYNTKNWQINHHKNDIWYLNVYEIQKEGTNLDFINFNTPAIFSIVEEEGCKVFAEEIASAAERIIKTFKENIAKANQK